MDALRSAVRAPRRGLALEPEARQRRLGDAVLRQCERHRPRRGHRADQAERRRRTTSCGRSSSSPSSLDDGRPVSRRPSAIVRHCRPTSRCIGPIPRSAASCTRTRSRRPPGRRPGGRSPPSGPRTRTTSTDRCPSARQLTVAEIDGEVRGRDRRCDHRDRPSSTRQDPLVRAGRPGRLPRSVHVGAGRLRGGRQRDRARGGRRDGDADRGARPGRQADRRRAPRAAPPAKARGGRVLRPACRR